MKIDHAEKKLHRGHRLHALVVAVPLTLLATCANAAYNVAISTNATSNMTLSGGVYSATGNSAVLNITDLKNALSSGNVTVNNGTGGSQNGDITVAGKLAWPAHRLTLDAYHSVVVKAVVKARGTSGLTITTNDGGTAGDLLINAGRIVFQNTSQSLTINGTAYTLVPDIATLATDISGNIHGNFALMDNYDASLGVTYTTSPMTAFYDGTFEGLGNTISNFKLLVTTKIFEVALFSYSEGAIRDLTMSNELITNNQDNFDLGGLVGTNYGLIENVTTGGDMQIAPGRYAGGLVGTNQGHIVNCRSSISIEGDVHTNQGGLVGYHINGSISGSSASGPMSNPNLEVQVGGLVGFGGGGTIDTSFATGNVTTKGYAGGLVGANGFQGINGGAISKSYATGDVTGNYDVGGLVGHNQSAISNSYSTGSATGASGANVGGFIGVDQNPGGATASYSTGTVATGTHVGGFIGLDSFSGSISNAYWDTTTSGITSLSQGAGSPANDPGITGQTTSQLQSGLPTGFSSTIWAESSTINGGLPYLKDNTP